MSWIDRPIEPVHMTPDQRRSRTMKLRRLENAGATGWSQPPTVVLVDWHLEDGCMTRTVGCE